MTFASASTSASDLSTPLLSPRSPDKTRFKDGCSLKKLEASDLRRFVRLNRRLFRQQDGSESEDLELEDAEALALKPSTNLTDLVAEASVELPKQAILENFVHHNPLEVLQNRFSFDEANAYMHGLFAGKSAFESPGALLERVLGTDPRLRANTALSELAAVFTDRGLAKWGAPGRDKGFLHFFATMESAAWGCSWRAHARREAALVLEQFSAANTAHNTPVITMGEGHGHENQKDEAIMRDLAEGILLQNLVRCFCPERAAREWPFVVRQMLFDMPGWAAMFWRMERHPVESPHGVRVSLLEFAAVQSILLRSSVEAMCGEVGVDPWLVLSAGLCRADEEENVPELAHAVEEESHTHPHDEQNPSALAWTDQNSSERERLEAEFAKYALSIVDRNSEKVTSAAAAAVGASSETSRPEYQFWACIDERECSFRRHLEEAGGPTVETLGIAGFFDFPIRFRSAEGAAECVLAPEGSQPKHVATERIADDADKTRYDRRRRLLAKIEITWERWSFCPVRSLLMSLFCWPISLIHLLLFTAFPETKRRLVDGFMNWINPRPVTRLDCTITPHEAAQNLDKVFRYLGLSRDMSRMAPMVVVVGHGSRTANNPYVAAYNCGACGGREGGPNARLVAQCANDPAVREILEKEFNLRIPADTRFVGCYHDTSRELVDFFDTQDLAAESGPVAERFQRVQKLVYEARARNALERCSKFMLAGCDCQKSKALAHVHMRSTDLGEARPELGHATNAAVIVGRRELTRGLFFARRAFLPSYDPREDDDVGTNLMEVLRPALIVCSGISLEYFYSSTEGGAGTKVAMNICGNVGVMQGTSGDLRVGLSTQTTELHSPMRSLFVVDTPVSRLQAVLSRHETLKALVYGDWVLLYVRDPDSGKFYRQHGGDFVEVAIPDLPAGLSAYGTSTYMPKESEGMISDSAATSMPPSQAELSERFVPFTHHLGYLLAQLTRERLCFWATLVGTLACCGVGIALHLREVKATASWQHTIRHLLDEQLIGAEVFVVIGATFLSLCGLLFSRRYLHGEFMYARLFGLHLGLLCGMTVVALADTIEWKLVGWLVLGFCSTFLIGAWNERPTARDNATYVFSLYALSDQFLLGAVAVAVSMQPGGVLEKSAFRSPAEVLIAVCLVLAATLKTSQLPFANLLARSVEGSSPSSAISDGGLSVHCGVVLLATTQPLWFSSVGRVLLASIGLSTAAFAAIVARVHADRKGGLVMAATGTLGLIYAVLAMGFPRLALMLSFGHGCLRMVQLLRGHNVILEHHELSAALGHDETGSKEVSPAFYRFVWAFYRFNTDMQLPHVCHLLPRRVRELIRRPLHLSVAGQLVVTFVLASLAGLPFTPITDWREHALVCLMLANATLAVVLVLLFVAAATFAVWFIFAHVIDPNRFRHKPGQPFHYNGPSSADLDSRRRAAVGAAAGDARGPDAV